MDGCHRYDVGVGLGGTMRTGTFVNLLCGRKIKLTVETTTE